jgi:hypothetical protein
MDKIELSDIQGNVKLADVKLSSLSLSADAVVSTINKVIDEVNSKGGGDFLPLSGGTLTGAVSSTSDVTVDGKLTVGDKIAIATEAAADESGLLKAAEHIGKVVIDGTLSTSGAVDVGG